MQAALLILGLRLLDVWRKIVLAVIGGISLFWRLSAVTAGRMIGS
jgi:hypothetical protein